MGRAQRNPSPPLRRPIRVVRRGKDGFRSALPILRVNKGVHLVSESSLRFLQVVRACGIGMLICGNCLICSVPESGKSRSPRENTGNRCGDQRWHRARRTAKKARGAPNAGCEDQDPRHGVRATIEKRSREAPTGGRRHRPGSANPRLGVEHGAAARRS